METDELKHAIEALLFASEKPLSIEQIKEAFEENLDAGDIRSRAVDRKSVV